MWMLVGVLAAAGTALRLFHIDMDAYWRNELFSIYWIRHSYAFLMTQGLISETNPPLHFVLLKAWTSLFGTSAIAARSLSTLASVACIPLTYMLGQALGGARIGLLGAGLLAASPAQIYYADEARGYALLTMFVLIALLGLCRFLSGSALRPHGADRAATRMTGLALYVAGAVALLYTHAIAVFILAALFVTMLLMFVDAGLGRARIRAFLIANAVIGLLGAPAVLAMAWQANSPNIEWMPRFGLDQLIITVRYLLLGPMTRDVLGKFWIMAMLLAEMGLSCFAAIALFAIARSTIKDRLALGMLLVFPALFLLLVCGVSLARPVLIPRVTLWLAVPIDLAAGYVLVSRLSLRAAHAGGFAAAGLHRPGIMGQQRDRPDEHKPDWPAMLAEPGLGSRPGEILVAGPHAGPLGVMFYSHGHPPLPLRRWQPEPGSRREHGGATGRRDFRRRADEHRRAGRVHHGRRPSAPVPGRGRFSLIDPVVSRLPGFAQARRQTYPGLTVFAW